MSKARLLSGLVVLLLLAGAGFYFFKGKAAGSKTEFQTIAVRRGDIEEVITSQGKLEPKEYVDVGVQVSGQIKALHVEIGDDVHQGDLLAEIDPRVYQSKVAADEARIKSLNAQIAQQNAEVSLADAQYRRNKILLEEEAVSQAVFDTAETALKSARAQAASLRAQLEEAQSTLAGDQANLGFTKIFAPMDGTITTQPVREGQTVNATQSAPTVMQVANLSVMTVRAQVAEADITGITPDMNVYFTTLGSERKWNAKVRQLLPSPETVNDVVLYNVLADVDNDDGQLMTGMSAQMFFAKGSAKNVLIVPASVLGNRAPDQDNASGKAYKIRILQNGKPAEHIVHAGLMTRTEAEITDGASEGEQVILSVPQVKENGTRPAGGGRMAGPRL